MKQQPNGVNNDIGGHSTGEHCLLYCFTCSEQTIKLQKQEILKTEPHE